MAYPEATILIAEDIAARAGGELRPAALERVLVPGRGGRSFHGQGIPSDGVTIEREKKVIVAAVLHAARHEREWKRRF